MASTSASAHGRRVQLLPTRPPPSFLRSAGRQVVGVALIVLLLHSVLVMAGIDEEATVMVNLVFAFVVLAVASFAGLDQRNIGLVTSREGWLLAAVAGGVTAVLVVAAAAAGLVPSDAAVAALPTPAVWFRVLVAIPIGTAVCEEIIFRGALLATLDRSPRRGGRP
jgi:membrane protease YdiL (CAAX protease family)